MEGMQKRTRLRPTLVRLGAACLLMTSVSGCGGTGGAGDAIPAACTQWTILKAKAPIEDPSDAWLAWAIEADARMGAACEGK